MGLREVIVEPVTAADEGRYQRLMQAHHYLGALPKIGETLWYVARWRREWVALIGFSAPALKCRARDAWIGWDFRVQYDRLHLVTDNSRFLILPGWHRPNLASRLLSRCERRLVSDWPKRFGHPLLLLETFVDPSRFRGTIYRASNWLCLGHTRGYKAMAEWADDLTQRARERFRCRRYDGLYAVPSESIIRNVLVRVDPAQLDRARQRWNDAHGADDEVLAIDGKTLCNAIYKDQDGPCQTHILSAVGHRSQTTHTQKK